MANEFVTRNGLIIKTITTGTTETKILVVDDTGLVKLKTSTSLGGSSGTSGNNGSSGSSGSSGTSGTAGTSGTSGTAGTSGSSGSSGNTGLPGNAGTSGSSGSSGTSGGTGSSGTSGSSGSSGNSGGSGSSGTSGTSVSISGTNNTIVKFTSSSTIGNSIITESGASASIAGSFLPSATTTYDLGSATYRWNIIYTADMSLKNEYGDYTLVEGENDLFLYNNKSGKVYKFNLTEVDKSVAPPKKVDK